MRTPVEERNATPANETEHLDQVVMRGIGWGVGVSAAIALYALSWLPYVNS